MAHPQHQLHMHNLAEKKYSKDAKKRIQVAAYIVGIGGNVAVVPQIITAWQGPSPGLAVLTWILFICFGLVWLAYAIIYKQKPLIVAQLIGISFNILVVLGWAINRQ